MAESKGGKTAAAVRLLAEPLCADMGLMLWDVRYEKEGATWYLKVTIDRESGIDMNTCEEFSRKFNDILDEADPIDESYVFEAGSPGLGRELRTPAHFRAFVGKRIRIGLFAELDGSKELVGTLTAYSEKGKRLTIDDNREITVSETRFIRAADEDI